MLLRFGNETERYIFDGFPHEINQVLDDLLLHRVEMLVEDLRLLEGFLALT